MREETIKLSKKERLRIKKKISIIMMKQNSLIDESSPSYNQISRSRTRTDTFLRDEIVVPYPYWVGEFFSVAREWNSTRIAGMPVDSYIYYYKHSRMSSSVYTSNSKIPRKLLALSNDSNEAYVYCERNLVVQPGRCTITTMIGKTTRNRRGIYFYPKYKVKIAYSKESGRLCLATTVPEYELNKMVEFINMILFETMTY